MLRYLRALLLVMSVSAPVCAQNPAPGLIPLLQLSCNVNEIIAARTWCEEVTGKDNLPELFEMVDDDLLSAADPNQNQIVQLRGYLTTNGTYLLDTLIPGNLETLDDLGAEFDKVGEHEYVVDELCAVITDGYIAVGQPLSADLDSGALEGDQQQHFTRLKETIRQARKRRVSNTIDISVTLENLNRGPLRTHLATLMAVVQTHGQRRDEESDLNFRFRNLQTGSAARLLKSVTEEMKSLHVTLDFDSVERSLRTECSLELRKVRRLSRIFDVLIRFAPRSHGCTPISRASSASEFRSPNWLLNHCRFW